MAQQSARRGWDNQGFPLCFEHAMGDLDPVRELPYRPAAVFLAASKAGQMTASDHAQQRPQRFPLPERGRPQMDDALFRPEVREAYRRLVAQGWTDALRALHPDERIYTFWKYFRNAF